MQTNVEITPYSWVNLRAELPEQFHKIVDLCYEMETYFTRINKYGIRFVTENRLRKLADIAQRILFEYMVLVRPKHEEVKKDLQKEYEMLFLGGRDSFLRMYIQADPSKKPSYLQAFLLQFYAFIHFRIYDSLSQIEIGKEVRERFIVLSLAKTGLFEKLGEKEDEFKNF